MSSNRKTTRIVGVLLIACTVATTLSIPFSAPILDDPDYSTSLAENQTLVTIGALVEFIWTATCAGTVVWLYPIF